MNDYLSCKSMANLQMKQSLRYLTCILQMTIRLLYGTFTSDCTDIERFVITWGRMMMMQGSYSFPGNKQLSDCTLHALEEDCLYLTPSISDNTTCLRCQVVGFVFVTQYGS